VWAPPPTRAEGFAAAVANLRRRKIEVRWTLPHVDAGLGTDAERRSPVADYVDEAVRARARSAGVRGERILRRLGVRLQGHVLVKRAAPAAEAAESDDAREDGPSTPASAAR
jgi:hypothetical protein